MQCIPVMQDFLYDFEETSLAQLRLHVFDKKIQLKTDVVIYYCNLKEQFSI